MSFLLVSFLAVSLAKTRSTIGVCLTGQLSRVASSSNIIENFLKPMKNAGWDIDVFIVLSESKRWTNDVPKHYRAFRETLDNLERVFSTLLSTKNVIVDNFEQVSEENSHVHPKYIDSFFDKPNQNSRQRATNHLRQWQTMQRCWQLMIYKRRGPYDMYARLREDSIFMFPWSPPFEWLKEDAVHVPACMAWLHGLNDKAAFVVGFEEAEKYFNGLSRHHSYHFSKLTAMHKVVNPESFLYASLLADNITVHQECPDELPHLVAVKISQRSYCVKRVAVYPPTGAANGLVHSSPNGGRSCFQSPTWNRLPTCMPSGQNNMYTLCDTIRNM